mmetsp:Transcript_144873/g.449722  ORF Transcript_144873/g.449722 Transcript_144873/m.449722 type:complete len:498 (+) Transcript_144873:125-1618(+)
MAYHTELPINESPGPGAYARHAEFSPRGSATMGRASRNTDQWLTASCAPGVQTPGVGRYESSKAWKRASSWYGSSGKAAQSAVILKPRDACLQRGDLVACDLMTPRFDSSGSQVSTASPFASRSKSQSPGPGAYDPSRSRPSSSFAGDIYLDRSPRGPCLARGDLLVRDLRHTQREVRPTSPTRAPASPRRGSPGPTRARGAVSPRSQRAERLISQGPCLPGREASARDWRPLNRCTSAQRRPAGGASPKGSGRGPASGPAAAAPHRRPAEVASSAWAATSSVAASPPRPPPASPPPQPQELQQQLQHEEEERGRLEQPGEQEPQESQELQERSREELEQQPRQAQPTPLTSDGGALAEQAEPQLTLPDAELGKREDNQSGDERTPSTATSSAAQRPGLPEEEQASTPSPSRTSRAGRSSLRLSLQAAEWQIKQDNRWQDLGPEACRLLFQAEATGQTKVLMTTGTGQYEFSLEAMTQCNVKTKRVRQMRKNPDAKQ